MASYHGPSIHVCRTSQYTYNCNGAISCDEGRFPEPATDFPPSPAYSSLCGFKVYAENEHHAARFG